MPYAEMIKQNLLAHMSRYGSVAHDVAIERNIYSNQNIAIIEIKSYFHPYHIPVSAGLYLHARTIICKKVFQ